jgi:predicted  nucleic acid-binding Zn-ribbon protein
MTNEISELKPLLLQLISKMDAGFAELRQDVTELKQGQVELKQDVTELKQDVSGLKKDVTELKQDVAELKRDVGDLKRVTSSNHFVVTGRLDEQRGILTDHLAKPLEHAHQR